MSSSGNLSYDPLVTAMPTNRLSRETSPYLLQHQHNPVDWFPWGTAAFNTARKLNKPIFLSVGYSTCYWCHVMERQCFENPEIAKLMNEHFVNIKVDREERPDVDQLYMTALQVLTRQGGWPMSVWLLPDKRPFFAGTYFPPESVGGRPSFPGVLEGLAEAFKERRSEIEGTAEKLNEILVELAKPTGTDEALTLAADWIAALLVRCIDDYEPKYGGFGHAPKFPRETLLDLLLWAMNSKIVSAEQKQEIAKPLRHALDAMANGGIRDHLGGAFHRYSTDAQWLVPHFEIMLYDNAMLARIYAEAAVTFNDLRYADVARRILDFVLAEMTSPEGLFYTAFDAEVDAREGLNYLWTMGQIDAVLPPREAAKFALVYGVSQGPNFADPHHGDGTPDQNVLFLAKPESENDDDVVAMRAKLYEHRKTRRQPLLDTKILTSWNALMIRALAYAGRVLDEPKYRVAAKKAAGILWREHRTPDGGLYRTSSNGAKKHAAMLDDYAFFAQALIELDKPDYTYDVLGAMRDRFEDPADGAFFFTDARADDLIVRQKVASDSPLPAGNAVAALVCDELGFGETAARALAAFALQTNHHAPSMCASVEAVGRFIEAHGPLRVEPTQDETARIASPAELAEQAVQILWSFAGASRVKLDLNVTPGLHLNAWSMTIRSPNAKIDSLDRPTATRKTYPYAPGGLDVYDGNLTFHVNLADPPTPGEPARIVIEYQPCTEDACLPLVTRTVEVSR